MGDWGSRDMAYGSEQAKVMRYICKGQTGVYGNTGRMGHQRKWGTGLSTEFLS